MNDLPSWVQVLQALVTPAVAGAVAVIGFLQWRTAHQKVILDLFERRLKVYDAVNSVVGEVLIESGNLVTINAAIRLRKARSEAEFLFGEEVTAEMERLLGVIAEYGHAARHISSQSTTDQQRDTAADKMLRFENELGGYHELFTSLCRPYLKMDQKRVRTPAEWLRERNEFRKSFDDQK